MDTATILTGVIFASILGLPVILIFLLIRLRSEKRLRVSIESRFRPVLDVEAEVQRLSVLTREQEGVIAKLRSDYLEKRAVYDRLKREVSIFDEKLAFAEMGVYEPHFEYTDSEAYKAKIEQVRVIQKDMISAKTAVVCPNEWTVDGSKSKGATMTGRGIRLTLRAFNNECEAAIANTRWNNINAMEKRILRAREQIDNLNASENIYIKQTYLDLKIKELFLTHEFREELRQEKEERAESSRLAREEQKLLRDLENAQQEEDRYKKMLANARAEAAKIDGPTLDAFTQQIASLEKALADAHAKTERAQAMAEKTRSGFVYIISNVGSFGPDVVKIGLTRRLDPSDRVRELGDASVPFIFDTHAMIYSDDAPNLERALHFEFEKVRINTENVRKEFFRVSLNEVEDAVARIAPDADFFKDVEAQEYFESLARRNAFFAQTELTNEEVFPASL